MGEMLTDLQFDILDTLYFVEPFEKIIEEVNTTRPILIDELRTMIDRGWIQVMEFDKGQGDYFRTSIFDTDKLETYFFLATKEGLLKHNGH
ncbi:MAG: hypothetical protein AAF694_08720 [Bacteroidota bacterium]